MEKEYSPYYWHNKALREHPEYQLEGMMDCLREEIGMAMPVYHTPEVTEAEVKPTFVYFKNDIRALELNRRVIELENANKYLLETIKEIRASASRRRPRTNKNLESIYNPGGVGGTIIN